MDVTQEIVSFDQFLYLEILPVGFVVTCSDKNVDQHFSDRFCEQSGTFKGPSVSSCLVLNRCLKRTETLTNVLISWAPHHSLYHYRLVPDLLHRSGRIQCTE
jgi:hypothetical protein